MNKQIYIDTTIDKLDSIATGDSLHIDRKGDYKPVEVLQLAQQRELIDALKQIAKKLDGIDNSIITADED